MDLIQLFARVKQKEFAHVGGNALTRIEGKSRNVMANGMDIKMCFSVTVETAILTIESMFFECSGDGNFKNR